MLKPKYTGRNSTHLIKFYLGNGVFSDYKKIDSPFSTPWGRAIKIVLFHRGMRLVTTEHETGVMISKRFACKYILDDIIAKGFNYGGYVCYAGDILIVKIQEELLRIDPSLEAIFEHKYTRRAKNYVHKA